GQALENVRFLSHGATATVLLSRTDVLLAPFAPGAPSLRVQFAGGSAAALVGEDPLPQERRYRRSALDESGFETATFAAVRYCSVYPGVDVVVLPRGTGVDLRFDVMRGASAAPIRVAVSGAEAAGLGTVSAHQRLGRRWTAVPARLRAVDGTLTFELGAYDVRQPLSVDLPL